ncbi:MAG: PAS domain-containing protein, partial [Planctomycetes bacterium]|nr:PAS domain-containing protein [Planctomycetota bacterium]
MNSRTHAQHLAGIRTRTVELEVSPRSIAPSTGLAFAPWLAAPALESASSWAWPAATAAAAAIALAAFLRSRAVARRADELAAERREAEAVASAHEKELERVSTALRLEIATLTRALANERRLFDAGPVTMFRWRAAEGWPVEYASPNVVQLFGWTAQEFMTGRVRYAEVVHAEDLERVVAEVTEHSARGAPFFEQDYRVRDKHGATRWLYDITLVERDEGGAITHYVGYVLDRTERQH